MNLFHLRNMSFLLCETKKMEFEMIFFVFLAGWLTFYGEKGKKRRKEK